MINDIENRDEEEEEILEVRNKEKCKDITLELIGWGGSVLIVTAYVMDLDILNDFLLNTIGSASLVGVCYRKKAYQPLVINTAWVISGLYKYFLTVS